MRKNFNSVQMLETSEVCNKISKSVSYETLVGGTTTICTDIKQTQRLSEGSADKPLSAVGTLTSLLCNSAKVMEKLLQRLLIFRLAKIISLVAVLSINMVGESQAAEIPTGGVSGTCNSAGTCLWNLDENGKMTISAAAGAKNVVMDDYDCPDSTLIGNRPWEQHIGDIENIVVESNISNIGAQAFQNAVNIKTVTGMKNVKSIGTDCFAYAYNLTSIEMPAVEYLAPYSLDAGTKLTSVDMPNIKTIEASAFAHAKALQYVGLPVDENGNPLNVNIGDNAFYAANAAVRDCTNANRSACGSCGNGYIMGGRGCVSDCGAGYLGKDGRCIDASLGCGAGYRQFENFCNRIQYTPAEAAKVLRDGNTNSVTITFKK